MPAPDSNRLVIANYPVMIWIMSAVFIVFSLFVTLMDGPLYLGLCFGGAGLLVFIAFGLGSRLVMDKREGVARLTEYTIAGKRVRELLLNEILAAETASTGRNSYRTELVLDGGESLPLTNYSMSGLVRIQLQTDKIQRFLGKEQADERVASALGISRIKDQLLDQMYQPTALEGPRGDHESGLTEGVSWQIQRVSSASGGKITRWFSSDARTSGGFVMLVQGGGTQSAAGGLGGLLGSFSQLAYKQYIGMYQIGAEEVPGLERAQPVQNLDPRLAAAFFNLTDDSYGARQVLNPWAVAPLAAWAAHHPVRGLQLVRDNTFGPLFVLFSPKGVTLAFASQIDRPEMIAEITRMGVELVKANSTQEPASS